jgi:hypothetical protein
MKTISFGLRLVVQLVHPVESFGIGTHTLASEIPYVDTKSNDCIWCQLMKVYLKNFQNFSNHLMQRETKSCPEGVFKTTTSSSFGSGITSSPANQTSMLHSRFSHVVCRHSRFTKFNVVGFRWAQNSVILFIFILTPSNCDLFSFSNRGTFGNNLLWHNKTRLPHHF